MPPLPERSSPTPGFSAYERAVVFGLGLLLLLLLAAGALIIYALRPGAAPIPLDTPAPPATYTPYPTFTPLPSLTPYPTFTPQPTFTPRPTNTAYPTFLPQLTRPGAGVQTQVANPGTAEGPGLVGVGNPIDKPFVMLGLGAITVDEVRWIPGQVGLALAHVIFTCERLMFEVCNTNGFVFDLVGASGTEYERVSEGFEGEEFGKQHYPGIMGGEAEVGFVAFLVTQPEDTLTLIVRVFARAAPIYFKLSY